MILLFMTAVGYCNDSKGIIEPDIKTEKPHVVKKYYPNEQLQSEVIYENARMNAKYFHENGQLASETDTDSKDFSNVIQRQYNKQGVMLNEKIIKDGQMIKDVFYCSHTMDQIFIQWFPSHELLAIEDRYNLLKENDISNLKRMNLDGLLKVRSGGGNSRECEPARAIFIFQKPVTSLVTLNLPKAATIIYIQKNDGWKKAPSNAPTINRTITFEPDKHHADWMLYMSELESGGHTGASIILENLGNSIKDK